MAVNFPGPYEIRINYTTLPAGVSVLGHQMRINYNNANTPAPGSDVSLFDYIAKDSSVFDVASWLATWIGSLRAVYPASTNFVDYEIWKYAAGTTDGQFQSSATIGLAGTGGIDEVPAGQAIVTFRSANGGHGRLNLMEAGLASGFSQSFPTSVSAVNTIAAAWIAADALPYSRDNSYFFSALRYHPGISEALYKKRFRLL